LFRVLQGICGGALQPLSQAIMLEAFPPERRGKAMGFWAVGIVVAPILGPVLGGWLTDNYSWRWIFYINIPVGVVSLVMTRLFIFDPPYIRRQSESIDYWGIGLLALGVGALQLVLDKGQQEDWFESRWFAWLNLNAGYWDFFWPQFVQGAALSLLFVPLTTITMYPVPKEKTGNATSIFNFMRNLGGSMGIAMISTMMERRRQLHVALLSRHVTPYDAPARVLDQSLRGAMIGGGSDPA